jgi:hypothetical protein
MGGKVALGENDDFDAAIELTAVRVVLTVCRGVGRFESLRACQGGAWAFSTPLGGSQVTPPKP